MVDIQAMAPIMFHITRGHKCPMNEMLVAKPAPTPSTSMYPAARHRRSKILPAI